MRRPTRGRWAAITLAAAVATAAITGPGAAAQDGAAAGSIGLASQSPWVPAGEAFSIRLDVDRVSRPDQLDLVVEVHRAVTSRSQFVATLDHRLLGRLVAPSHVTPLVSVPFDPGGAKHLVVPLPTLGEGVYPVSVALRDRETDEAVDDFITHLVRVPDIAAQPLRVAWVQSVDAGTTLAADGVRRIPERTLRQLARTAGALADAAEVPLTLDIAPDTVDGLVAAQRADILTELARGMEQRQLVAAPYVDVDPGALVAAGLSAELDDLRSAGEAVVAATFGATDPSTWSSEVPLTEDALARLRRDGVDRVVVPDEDLSPLRASLTGRRTLARPFRLRDSAGSLVDAAVADSGLAAHFDDDGGSVLAAHHLLADLAVLYLDSPGTLRGVVVRTPSDVDVDATFLSTVLPALGRTAMLEPVTVTGLFDAVPRLGPTRSPTVRTSTHTEADVTDNLPARLSRLRSSLLGLTSLTGGDTTPLQLLRPLLFTAEHDRLRPIERTRLLDAVGRGVEEIKANVHIVGGRTFRLTAREGTIPLTVVNDNQFPVEVTLELSSEKLQFTDAVGRDRSRRTFGDVQLGAQQSRVLTVPVKARTSAKFFLRATLRSPDGSVELGRSRLTVISTAVSGLGIVLSASAGLFLLVWWARHWRSARRSRRLIAASDDSAEAPEAE